ncbi:uncharacterized protein AtWU_09484 [Aspergillus tubingensis]|uniref:uncharacterized protein n=1 Tax=Aspergillus tubingensis TaxID=5068 RepID=UPI001578EC48|nr:uncharacterized protein AtWU_09484 [Aspergillus tubingensis]GFN19679.1 hypothetical protein AtWU_09484 [Aspergillus tubingensis]
MGPISSSRYERHQPAMHVSDIIQGPFIWTKDTPNLMSVCISVCVPFLTIVSLRVLRMLPEAFVFSVP